MGPNKCLQLAAGKASGTKVLINSLVSLFLSLLLSLGTDFCLHFSLRFTASSLCKVVNREWLGAVNPHRDSRIQNLSDPAWIKGPINSGGVEWRQGGSWVGGFLQKYDVTAMVLELYEEWIAESGDGNGRAMKTLLRLLISVIWASVIVLGVDRCGQTLDISESWQALLIVSEIESPETDETMGLKSYFFWSF